MAAEQHILTRTAPSARLLVIALLLTGLSMRTAVTSVGAVLDDLDAGLHTSSGIAGLITTLPVICFSGFGALTPRLAHHLGPTRLLMLALAATTAGLAARAVVGTVWLFVLLSLLALGGGAVSNVLLPSLIKRYAPERIGRMTALYTTALAVGTTLAAGLTVPIGDIGGGWRTGIGSWALLSALAVPPWLPWSRHETPEAAGGHRPRMGHLIASPTARALTAFFAFQSLQAYIGFGWFATFLRAHQIGSGTAGWMVALFSAISIPVSMVVPTIDAGRLRAAMLALSACSLLAYLGLALAPRAGAWAWMVLSGLGSGTFPIALTLIGLRTRQARATAALSSFVQSIGYIVAGAGPLLFGVLHGATGGWTFSLALLFVALVVTVIAGIFATRARFVDDELGSPETA